MIDSILVSGISGVLIIGLVYGFGITLKINHLHKEEKISFISAVRKRGLSLVEWLCFAFFILFCLMIAAGIVLAIFVE